MDESKISYYWAIASSNSSSNLESNRESESGAVFLSQNQESESLVNPNPDPDEETEEAFRTFQRTIREAELNLMPSLRAKLATAIKSSQTEILALKRRLHESETKNSELTQENSQLRKEKESCEWSLELAQMSISVVDRGLEMMTRKKTEVESKLEEKVREISTLQFRLSEKEEENQKLTRSVLLGVRKKWSQNVWAFENPTSFSSAPLSHHHSIQTQMQTQEQIEINSPGFSGSDLPPLETLAVFTGTFSDQEKNQEQNQNQPSNPQTSEEICRFENVEENYGNVFCRNSNSTCENMKQKTTRRSKSRLKSPQIDPENVNFNVKTKSPQGENRFEKFIVLQLKRAREGAIFKPSSLNSVESEEEQEQEEREPLRKRSRSFYFSATHSSTCGSSHQKTNRKKTGPKPNSSSVESVLTIPEIYRTNYGFTNCNRQLENCPHARDFWYDSDPVHSTVPKFLLRFHKDEEFKRLSSKLFHVKRQERLEEPKIKYEYLRHLCREFKYLCHKSGSDSACAFRLWLDVRGYNIFSGTFSRFLLDFGRFITHFSFTRRLIFCQGVELFQLLNFVLDHFPNLEYLAVNDQNFRNTHQSNNQNQRMNEKKLEKLKTIRLMSISYQIAAPFIIQLILKAPALQQIYGIPLHCLAEIQSYFKKNNPENSKSNLPPACQKEQENLEGGKEISMNFHFVKQLKVNRNVHDETSYTFRADPKTFLNDLSTLCLLNPPLEAVDIRTYFIRDPAIREICVEKWSQLLRSIKNHVKSLKIGPHQMQNFPRLKNLNSLHFDIDLRHFESTNFQNFRYFPPQFDFSHNFPQLEIIEIGLNKRSSQILKGDDGKSNNLFHSHFPSDVFYPCANFSRVRRLNLVNFAPPTCFTNLKALFPRLTIFQLSLETSEMSQALPMVFKFWPGLKQLILELSFSSFSHAEYNLDSAFSGFHASKCRILAGHIREKNLNSHLELEPKAAEEKIRKPSIQDLKDLTLLKIVLNLRKCDRDYGIPDCLMTPVSGIYGFGPDQMPNLKVVVAFDEKMTTAENTSAMNLLEPMNSYLTFDH